MSVVKLTVETFEQEVLQAEKLVPGRFLCRLV